MKYALFLGCNIPARVGQYELSSRAVLGRLGVELVELRRFNCCGYPMRNVDEKAFLYSSAKNLAVAEKEDLPILTLCKCCYGGLKNAAHMLEQDPQLKVDLNKVLEKRGLRYEGRARIEHLLTVLHREVGLERIREAVTRPFDGLRIAAHYGCHALRPSGVTHFDDPIHPTIFEDLVDLTGAESVEWGRRLECCGAPLMGVNDGLSTFLTGRKLSSGKEAGAHYICTACPFCHLQFDWVQQTMISSNGDGNPLPSVLYPQLLGLAMGMDEESVGIGMNRIDIRDVGRFLRLE